MARRYGPGFLCAFLVLSAAAAPTFQPPADAGPKTPDQAEAASAAAAASPELVGELSKEIGATPEQAAGAAGALFGVAKSRLKPEEFSQVASAVPGMNALLKAAPAAGGGPVGTTGALSQAAGAAGGLAAAGSAFTKLGLQPSMVSKAIPVLTQYVSKSGGANVGSLLAGALK